jgi:hypothetical protein
VPRDSRRLKPAADDYRRAGKAALEQLDWAIEYLYRIRKAEIASILRRNRTSIAERLD